MACRPGRRDKDTACPADEHYTYGSVFGHCALAGQSRQTELASEKKIEDPSKLKTKKEPPFGAGFLTTEEFESPTFGPGIHCATVAPRSQPCIAGLYIHLFTHIFELPPRCMKHRKPCRLIPVGLGSESESSLRTGESFDDFGDGRRHGHQQQRDQTRRRTRRVRSGLDVSSSTPLSGTTEPQACHN